jgi:hypothetical protein
MESLLLNSCSLIPNKRVNCNIDMKNIIFLMTMIVGLSAIISQPALAQNNTQTPILTKLMEERITTYVTVLSESPVTLILQVKGDYQGGYTHLGQAIDIAKQKGYSIDAVTVFTETSAAIGSTRYLTPNYTVFMSK